MLDSLGCRCSILLWSFSAVAVDSDFTNGIGVKAIVIDHELVCVIDVRNRTV